MDSYKEIDINCDVGEGIGNEAELFPLISSCNIACGGHAGNTKEMKEIVQLAKLHKVKVGAHPSYPDKAKFGRVSMDITADGLTQSIRRQIENLVRIAAKAQIGLNHIKPHGALYNDIAKNESLANVFLRAIASYRTDVHLYVPYASVIAREALDQGFKIKYEAFADRNYNADLSLVSRKSPKAFIDTPEPVLKHVLHIVRKQAVKTVNGERVRILADTFCVHGDTVLAFEIVLYLSKVLPNHNIYIKK